MTSERDITLSLAFSGCSVLAFLFLLGFALLKTARRFGKGEAVPVLAFRVPLPLREVAGRLSKVSAELPDLPKDAKSLAGFLAAQASSGLSSRTRAWGRCCGRFSRR